MKLGYGGTQEEMKRLVHDASQMTDVQSKLNVSVKDGDLSFANIANAISVVQDNLGIAGTTAEEAKTTFSGSFGMMKAAAMDLMGYLGAEEMYSFVPQALENLATSVDIFFFGNFLPMVGRIVEQIPSVLSQGLGMLTDRLNNAGSLATSGFITGFIQGIPGLIKAAAEFVAAIVNYIITHKDEFFQIARDCVEAFVKGLGEVIPMSEETMAKLPGVIEKALQGIALLKVGSILQPFVSQFGGVIGGAFKGAWSQASTFFGLMKSGGGVFSNLALMVSQGTGPMASLAASFVNAGGGLSGFVALLKGFGSALISAIASPVALITAAIAALIGAFMHLWNTNDEFKNNMIAIWNDLVSAVNDFCQGVVDRVNALGFDFESVGEMISAIWNGFCEMLAPVFEGAWAVISAVLQGALDIITGLLDIFIGLFTGNWSQLWTGVQEIAAGVWNAICGIFSAAWNMIIGLLDWFCGLFGTTWSATWASVQATVSSIWNGIVSFLSGIWNGLVATATSIFNNIKTAVTQAMQSAIDMITNIWNGVTSTLSSIWNGIVSTARSIFDGVYNAIVGPFQRAKETVQGIWDWITGHSEVNVKVNQSSGGYGSSSADHAAGGVFTRATLLPSVYGATHLVGEAGPEAILPLTEFYRSMDRSIKEGYSAAAANPQLDVVIDLLAAIAGKSTTIVMDKKTVGQIVADEVEKAINKKAVLRTRLAGG